MSALAVAVETKPAVSMTLAAMADELTCLLDTAEMVEEGTADLAELDAMVAQFKAELPAKVDRVNYALAFLESQEALAAAEGERIQAFRQRVQRDIERLEQYCCKVIESLPEPRKGQKRKLEGRTVVMSVRPSDEAIITDEEAVPIEYKTAVIKMPAEAWELIAEAHPEVRPLILKADLQVRKADVKKALKAGVEVSGADLKFNSNLRRA